MNNLLKYLSTIPVVAAIWMTFTAGLIIEISQIYEISTKKKVKVK